MNTEHVDTVFVCSSPYREVSANTWLLQASSPSSQLSALLPLSSVQLTGALPRSRDTPLWQTHTYMLFASVWSLGWLMTNSLLVTRGWCSFMPGKQWALISSITTLHWWWLKLNSCFLDESQCGTRQHNKTFHVKSLQLIQCSLHKFNLLMI